MSYTLKNLRQIDDSAEKYGFSETQEARFAQGDLRAEATGLSYHLLRPDKRQTFAHRHDEAEEVAAHPVPTGHLITSPGLTLDVKRPRRGWWRGRFGGWVVPVWAGD